MPKTTVGIKSFNDYFKENQDKIPAHKRDGDAGLDVRSMQSFVLKPGQHRRVPLGVGLMLPEGYFARVEGRSGNAAKYGIDTIGNIIDSNYTGEISAILVNNGQKDFVVVQGDRIAQIIVQPHAIVDSERVEDLGESNRGEAGFGSSGNA